MTHEHDSTTEPLDAAMDLLDHLNTRHSDTVLLVVRQLSGRRSATGAEAVAVDARGVDVRIEDRGDRVTERIEFVEPADSVGGIQPAIFGLLARARSMAGAAEPLTSLERELAETASLPTYHCTVESVWQLTPSITAMTIGGGFDGFRSLGGDQFLYVMIDRPNRSGGVEGVTMANYQAMEEALRPMGAYYTVRRWDGASRSMEMWFVDHGHEGTIGHWATTARAGDEMALWGPRIAYEPPDTTARHLLAVDDTGLAAAAALIDEIPHDTPITMIAEVEGPEHRPPLGEHPGLGVTWLYRGGAEPGTTGALLAAVRDLDPDPEGLAAFGAAESREITAVRKHLRHDLGVPAAAVSMTGYWRR